MPIKSDDLRDFVLQLRLLSIESLLLKIHLLLPKFAKPTLSIDASLKMTLEALEDTAALIERTYLRDEDLSALSPDERALFADEARDIFDKQKRLASSVARILKETERKQHGE